jgi:cobalt-zinc-cadmium efflux system membrane fusion protein
VSAPFAGVVIERLVSPGTAVTPGTPLLVVSDLSTVWVNAEVDEAHLAALAPGRPAEIAVAAYPGERFSGTVEAVGDVINPNTRRVTVRIAVPNPERRLKPQMFATVALGAAAPRRILVVPSRAVQQVEGETVVFVRSGEGTYQKRGVVLGAEADGLVEVARGVDEGEAVVTAGAFLLKSALAAPESE